MKLKKSSEFNRVKQVLEARTGFLKCCRDAIDSERRFDKFCRVSKKITEAIENRKTKYLAIALRPTRKRRVNFQQFEFKN